MPEYDDPFQKAAEGLSDEDLGLAPKHIRASRVKRARVRWVWPARLPEGKLVILDGDPDVGKSTLTLDLAARLSTATPLPDGYRPPEPVNVLFLGAEDALADTVVPRLTAAGADLERFTALEGMPEIDDLGRLTYRPPELPTDVIDIAGLITALAVGLVIIDPLVAFLADWVNSHKDQQVRRALTPLSKMAETTGATVLAIRHLNKSPGAPALYRGGGSIGMLAAARLVLVAAHDPDNDGQRLLAPLKSNLAPKAETLAYRIIPNEQYDCGEIAWHGTSKRTAAEILALADRTVDPDERSALDEAVAFLFVVLGNGPKLAEDIYRESRQAGVSERTLERAKRTAGVTSRKGLDAKGRWVWSLPDPEDLLEN
jgi:hypothetical protein